MWYIMAKVSEKKTAVLKPVLIWIHILDDYLDCVGAELEERKDEYSWLLYE